MVKKGTFFVFLIIFFVFFILLLPQISANFVCGKVNSILDSNSGEISASWFSVMVYYNETPEKTTTCKVSPADSKYCCDPNDIEGVSWEIGKQVSAEIFDTKKGYVAEPVSLIISGEGYDVFPLMELEKGIMVHSPNTSVFLSVDRIFVNISLASRFNQLEYVLNYSNYSVEGSVCTNCNKAAFYLENLTLGQYKLILIASNDLGEEMQEVVAFSISIKLDFGRIIECKGCRGNFVPTGKNVIMNIVLNSSEAVDGVLFDYFPVDWKFLKSDGIMESYSETHNVIRWNVQGKEIHKQYKLKSPRKIFTRKYIFQSGFEDVFGEEDGVILFKFYRFLSIPKRLLDLPVERFGYLRYAEISPSEPLVMFFKDRSLVEVIIFPKNETEDVYSYLQKVKKPRLQRAQKPFTLHTNLQNEDIEDIWFKFKIKKPSKKSYLKNVTLFRYGEESDKWEPLLTEKYKEDKRFEYFETHSEKKGIFSIKSEVERV